MQKESIIKMKFEKGQRIIEYQRDFGYYDAHLRLQILSLLDDGPLSNQEIRQLSGKSAQQVRKLMASMEPHGVERIGSGRGAKYQKNKQ
mgnify:CR=1 FL=1